MSDLVGTRLGLTSHKILLYLAQNESIKSKDVTSFNNFGSTILNAISFLYDPRLLNLPVRTNSRCMT